MTLLLAVILLFWASVCQHVNGYKPCVAQKKVGDSVVCVCNSTYCDTVPPAPLLKPGMFVTLSSSSGGERFNLSTGQVQKDYSPGSALLTVKRNTTRQSIIGFGGAFTDAAGINIASLPDAAQENLLQSYFSVVGIEYNIGRIPMGSCDFSVRPYSYDDVENDLELSHFALASEDRKYKIPAVQAALILTDGNLRLFGSPWSAPAWMKTNQNMTGNGTLIGQPGGPYYKAWANYFVRFVQEYAKAGIPMWGLTTQNEPSDGQIFKFPFQAMGWTAEQQRDFIKLDLGPALRNSSLQHLKLMILDDQRLMLPYWAKVVYGDAETRQYVSGVAVHWYIDDFVPINVLDFTHELQPDKFIFASEACNGDRPWEAKVILGYWGRGEKYAHDIIGDLNHWVTGWTDWNLALDLEGGPNWVKNFVDSPVIVNASAQEFYKQPMFYALGHFSKYLVPGSTWVGLESTGTANVDGTAFIRPDGSLALVLLNRNTSPVHLTISDPEIGYLDINMAAKSIQTVLWRSK